MLPEIRTYHHERFCFVFGSNLAGRHGKGAALTAKRFYKAEAGVGEGMTGNAYALPTKDRNLQVLPETDIASAVERFRQNALACPEVSFMVTRVGTGLAGFDDAALAPYFANMPENVFLPRLWRPFTRRPVDMDQFFRVVVAGSRDLTEANTGRTPDYWKEWLFDWLDHLFRDIDREGIEVVHGAAPGVDSLADEYAKDRRVGRLTRWPAAWKSFGRPAGHLRNHAMAWFSDGASVLRINQSSGSTRMIEAAKQEGLVLRLKDF